jgi:hypothetical protein
MRTLCVLCHEDESTLLAQRNAKRRHAAVQPPVDKAEMAKQKAVQQERRKWLAEGDPDFQAQSKKIKPKPAKLAKKSKQAQDAAAALPAAQSAPAAAEAVVE